jgi:glucose-1-phosphate cytidylyltransferase
MKIYYTHGIKEFIICLGYKGYVIKEYFANYCLHMSDVKITSKTNSINVLQNDCEDWTITLLDTGNETMTGGRLRRVSRFIGDETFCLTYGDGVGNIDITDSISFHRKQGTMATLTAVQPSGRFGAFMLSNDQDTISHFREKPKGDNAWINGGYFVLEPEVMEYISGDSIVWEREPLEKLATSGQLSAYRHHGFWHPMDTLRDKNRLEELWKSGEAPWKVW